MNRHRKATRNVAFTAISVAIIAICSYISIPFFSGISFTLQLLAVFLCAAVFSPIQSLSAVLIYILLGIMGVPVFSGFAGGISALMGPTGGYLIGFILSSLTISLSVKYFGRKRYVLTVSMLISLMLCYFFGALWFLAITGTTQSLSLTAALWYCVIPYVIPDTLKIILAICLAPRLAHIADKE